MRVRTLWSYLVVALVVLAAPAAWAKNYLIITMDDVSIDKIGAYTGDFPGYTPQYLPNTRAINALAANGLRFTRAWATPLCSPTRAAFQSGLQPSRTGVGTVLENGAPDLDTARFGTIAKSFAARGYTTGLFGKYHIGMDDANGVPGPPTTPTFTVRPHPSLAGWDRFFGNYDGYIGESAPGNGYFRWDVVSWFGMTGRGTTGVETTHATDRTEEIALNWISTRTQPWLVVVAFNAAHSATTGGTAWEYADVDPNQVRSTAALACLKTSNCPSKERQVYQALVEHMDLKIEALLNGLPPAMRDETVVVLFGDNGTPPAVQESVFSSIAGRGKDSTYENGVRVPLIVADASAWATGTPGPTIPLIDRRIDAKVHILDIYNTLYGDAFRVNLAGLDSMPFNDCFTNNDPYCNFPGKRYGYTEMFRSNASPSGAKIAVSYGEDTMVACYNTAFACMKETFYDTSTDPLQTAPQAWTGIRAQRLRDYFLNFHAAPTDWAHTIPANPVVPFCVNPAVPACP